MKTARIIILVNFLIFLMVGAKADADPGVKFWGMDVGNYWVWNGTGSLSGVWTWREDVVNIDTTTVPGQTTYYVEGHDVPGSVIDRTWYTFTSTEKRLWRRDFYGDDALWHTVIIPTGYRVGDTTVAIGGFWEDTGTAYFDGVPVSITVHNDVLSYEHVSTPLGTYKAYKVHRVINIPALGGIVEDGTAWFVPYIGVVRDRVDNIDGNPLDYEIEELASMKINKLIFDRDGDARTDVVVYRTSTGAWYVKPSLGAAPYGLGWGGDPNDKPVAGDYDGDGKTDYAVYRANTGAWYIYPSGGGAPYGTGWGGNPSDKPVPGDYDGDGKTDIAVYRANTGAWYIKPSSGAASYGLGWGGDPNDKPVPGDYDADGKTDIAVYRSSTGAWYVKPSSGASPYGVGWGGDPNDRPVPGDYDGDGKTDIAVYRASTGAWYVKPSSGAAAYGVGWGGDATDRPVPGDYDGDGKTDIAVYRASTGAWYIYPSGGGDPYGFGWGGDATDLPVTTNPGSYI